MPGKQKDFFAAQLDHLDKVANQDLRSTASALDRSAGKLSDQQIFSAMNSSSPWVDLKGAEQRYSDFKELLRERLAHAARGVNTTADSLAAVVKVYRIADGQK
jgi:hypothetical protein